MSDELEAPIHPRDDIRVGDVVTVDAEGYARKTAAALAIGRVSEIRGDCDVALIVPLEDLAPRPPIVPEFDTTTEE